MAPLSQLSQQQQPDLSIPKFFARLQDPRRAHRRLHHLQDIIVIALCAVIAGAQDWQDIETFGRKRRAWLRRFLELPNGIPSHDTFERVFDRLKPQAFQACFREWVRAIGAALGIEHDTYEARAKGHGRQEYRCYTVLHCTEGIRGREDWAGLTTIGICYSERTVGGETTAEARYFIGSKRAGAKYYGRGLRNHWGIENSLHWQLDVTFQEDRNRVTRRNAAE